MVKGRNTAQREVVVSLIFLDGNKGNVSTAADTAEWRLYSLAQSSVKTSWTWHRGLAAAARTVSHPCLHTKGLDTFVSPIIFKALKPVAVLLLREYEGAVGINLLSPCRCKFWLGLHLLTRKEGWGLGAVNTSCDHSMCRRPQLFLSACHFYSFLCIHGFCRSLMPAQKGAVKEEARY